MQSMHVQWNTSVHTLDNQNSFYNSIFTDALWLDVTSFDLTEVCFFE